MCVYFTKMVPKMKVRTFFWRSFALDFFRASLQKFAQKLFATPKLFLFQHLCVDDPYIDVFEAGGSACKNSKLGFDMKIVILVISL